MKTPYRVKAQTGSFLSDVCHRYLTVPPRNASLRFGRTATHEEHIVNFSRCLCRLALYA